MLGIEHPIILAPMGGAVGPELTAAVSNAGGLGAIPLWGGDPDQVRDQVRAVKSLTSAPFAVNLNLNFPMEDRLDVCLEEGVPVISFFWKQPGDLVRRAKDAGALVMYSVGDAEAARRAVDDGVDIIVAQGWEAGGHVRGTVATLPLVPTIVDAVGDTPVVAAGGIADGRGLAAVLALGAGAGWIGTRFLAAEEAPIHAEYRARILTSSETDTAYLENLFDGGWNNAAHRALRNSTIEAWEAAGRPGPGERPNEGELLVTSETYPDVFRYDAYTPRADGVGNIEETSMWAGQGVGLVRKVQPAAEIMREIMEEARAVIAGLNG